MLRRLVNSLLLCVCGCVPVHATWTLTQVKDNASCSGTTCAVTVTSTGAGHLLVAAYNGGASGSATTISGVSSAACVSTWTHATSANLFVSPFGSVDLYYCLNSASGQTAITITISQSGSGMGVIWEASSSLGNIAVNSGTTPSNNVHDTSNCTSCAGTSLTLASNNSFIAGTAFCVNTCSGVTGTGYTNDLSNPSGDAVFHGLNIAVSGATTAPATFSQSPTSTLFGDAAAFQETSGGVACTPTLTLLGVGRCG